jgi:hypothetical protein
MNFLKNAWNFLTQPINTEKVSSNITSGLANLPSNIGGLLQNINPFATKEITITPTSTRSEVNPRGAIGGQVSPTFNAPVDVNAPGVSRVLSGQTAMQNSQSLAPASIGAVYNPTMRSSTAFIGPVQAPQQQTNAYAPGGALYTKPFGGFSASDRGTGTVSGTPGAGGTQAQTFTQPMGGGGGGGSTGQGGITGTTEPGRFSGFGSGASGAATGGTALGGTADITQQKKQQGSQPAPVVMRPDAYTLPPGFTPTTTPQGGSAFKSPEGYTYVPSGTNQLQLAPQQLPGAPQLINNQYFDAQGSVQVQPTGPIQLNGPASTPFNAATPTGIDANASDAATRSIKELLATPGVDLSAKAFTDNYNTLYQKYYAENQAKSPSPEMPVVDTPGQDQFLKGLQPEQQGYVRQQMDALRSTLGLPNLEKSKVDLQNQLNALNTTFQEIQKDIKDNPELPKSLIARRMSEFASKNAINIQNLTGQLDIINQQIDTANEKLNQEFQISQYEQNFEEKRRTDAMNQLKMFIDSGAIAGFDANTISKYATATGMSAESLSAIKNAASKGDTKVVEAADGSWYKQTIKKDGSVSMERITGAISKPTTMTGDLTSTQNSNLMRITTKFQSDSIVNQALNGQNASDIADQVIANPGSATSQLKSLYLLVKNLDPTSAVREGELALANQTQSYLQQFQNTFARLTEGRVIAPDAAKALAVATKELTIAWKSSATRRVQQYQSQSDSLGVGPQFNEYIQGSNLPTSGGGGAPVDTSTINSDIQRAIKDTTNFKTREDLISALATAYGISKDEAAQKVYAIWTDNTKR